MNHTPGPWSNDDLKIESGFRLVALCSRDVDAAELAEDNARLIAAAPELLTAGEKVLYVLSTVLGLYDDPEETAVNEAYDEMAFAIAKAKGTDYDPPTR